MKAFIAVEGASQLKGQHIHAEADKVTVYVLNELNYRYHLGGAVHIEEIQDLVEKSLSRLGHDDVYKSYII